MGANEFIKILKEMKAIDKDSAVSARDIIDYMGFERIIPAGLRRGITTLKEQNGVNVLLKEREYNLTYKLYSKMTTQHRKLLVEYYYL